MCFIPETLPRIVIARALKKHELTLPPAEVAIVEEKVDVLREMRFITSMAFRIMLTEPIVVFLGIYNGFAYGLLFLYLDGVFDVFVVNNGLSNLNADLTYLNFVVAVTLMFCFVPVQTWFYRRDRRRNGGVGRPEARFLTSLVGVWGFPISLLWFAFTCDGNTSYWSPVIAGGVLGFFDPLLWLSMLNYIADSYTNVAASAIAAFLIPSFGLAAGCCHIGKCSSTSTSFARKRGEKERKGDQTATPPIPPHHPRACPNLLFSRHHHVRQPRCQVGDGHPRLRLLRPRGPSLRSLLLRRQD